MAEKLIRISVVIASFNRREKTLTCLRSVFAQSFSPVDISVYLFDDASSDGTAVSVRQEFPQVHVLEGDGNSFWGGGMFSAMELAVSKPYDFILWLNDDVELRSEALTVLFAAYKLAQSRSGALSVVVGSVVDPISGKITYSGFNRAMTWHPSRMRRVLPNRDNLVQCDAMNGNCVFMSHKVVEAVGLIDPVFTHQLGDIDYSYRVCKAGGGIWIAQVPVGYCTLNTQRDPWMDKSLSLLSKLKVLFHPLGLPFKPWFAFYFRYSPILSIFLILGMYLRVLISILKNSSRKRIF